MDDAEKIIMMFEQSSPAAMYGPSLAATIYAVLLTRESGIHEWRGRVFFASAPAGVRAFMMLRQDELSALWYRDSDGRGRVMFNRALPESPNSGV